VVHLHPEGWSRILGELATLRLADASGRYYYGLATSAPGSGIAGIGYLGHPVAMGYDAPSGLGGDAGARAGAQLRAAPHAVRRPGRRGPQLPAPGASIGVFGYDLFTNTVKTPADDRDLMSYCRPRWTSDYTFDAVMSFRNRGDNLTSGDAMTGAAPEPSLLVWGRLGASGAMVEPAFEVTTRPSLPSRAGPYTLQGTDAAGDVLFSYPFDAAELGEEQLRERQFAFAIPARLAQMERLAGLRVVGPGIQVQRVRADRSLRAGARPVAPRAQGPAQRPPRGAAVARRHPSDGDGARRPHGAGARLRPGRLRQRGDAGGEPGRDLLRRRALRAGRGGGAAVMRRSLLCAAAAVLAAAPGAHAQLSLEVRGGASAGSYAATQAGFQGIAGPSFGATAGYGLTPRLELFAGYSRDQFGCTDGFCSSVEPTFTRAGAEAGVRVQLPLRLWARGGVGLQSLGVEGGTMDRTSGTSVGVRLGAGAGIPLGPRLSVTPGVEYSRFTTDLDGGGDGVGVVAGTVGLRIRL
jgi:hypothetical protein